MNFVIAIDAIPQSRPRFFRGRAYDMPQCKQFKQNFSAQIQEKIGESELLECELKVEVKIYRPKSKFKKGVSSRRFGDVDNLAKGILDACNGVLWKDDSQIVELHIEKKIATTARIELSVEPYR